MTRYRRPSFGALTTAQRDRAQAASEQRVAVLARMIRRLGFAEIGGVMRQSIAEETKWETIRAAVAASVSPPRTARGSAAISTDATVQRIGTRPVVLRSRVGRRARTT